MLILAGNKPLVPEPSAIYQRMSNSAIQKSLERSGITTKNILNAYVSDETMLKVLRRNLEVNTDDFPVLEFSAPRSQFVNQSKEIVRSLYQLKYLAAQTD